METRIGQNRPKELYNLKEDRTELTNLVDKYPERVIAMKARWHEMSNIETKTSGKNTKPVSEKVIDWGVDQHNLKDRPAPIRCRSDLKSIAKE